MSAGPPCSSPENQIFNTGSDRRLSLAPPTLAPASQNVVCYSPFGHFDCQSSVTDTGVSPYSPSPALFPAIHSVAQGAGTRAAIYRSLATVVCFQPIGARETGVGSAAMLCDRQLERIAASTVGKVCGEGWSGGRKILILISADL